VKEEGRRKEKSIDDDDVVVTVGVGWVGGWVGCRETLSINMRREEKSTNMSNILLRLTLLYPSTNPYATILQSQDERLLLLVPMLMQVSA
jgi:hypothetical protein